MIAPDPQNIAVYIHWPFCTRICPYCDFNVYKTKDQPDLIKAIMEDLRLWRDWSGPRDLTSVHFGGGTPSLMSPQNIDDILSEVKTLWPEKDNELLEIALEANPSDYDAAKWRDFAQSGINRLSLGVQSYNDDILNHLGRNHDAKMAQASCEGAREIFHSLSLDLIFGSKGQSQDLLKTDFNTALSFGPDHLSTYQLTIEDGTAFGKARGRGVVHAVEPDISAAYFDHITHTLIKAGYEHYEISNFAKPGHRSAHNSNYWLGGDYVGVGPGAHGRISRNQKRFATTTHLSPQNYAAGLSTKPPRFGERSELSRQSWAEEYLLMGLRINEGISLARYSELSGEELPADILDDFIAQDRLVIEKGRLKATPTGRPVLNYLTQKLLGA